MIDFNLPSDPPLHTQDLNPRRYNFSHPRTNQNMIRIQAQDPRLETTYTSYRRTLLTQLCTNTTALNTVIYHQELPTPCMNHTYTSLFTLHHKINTINLHIRHCHHTFTTTT